MQIEKENALKALLANLGNTRPFFVTHIPSSFSSRRPGTDVIVGIRPPTRGNSIKRNTCSYESTAGTNPVVIFAKLTKAEKNIICEIMCDYAKKAGLKQPKICERFCKPEVISYRFR
jgi:hypothetical protein